MKKKQTTLEPTIETPKESKNSNEKPDDTSNKLPETDKKPFVRTNNLKNGQHSSLNTNTSKAAKFSSLFKNNHEIPRVGE